MRLAIIPGWLLLAAFDLQSAEDPWHPSDDVFASPGLDLYLPRHSSLAMRQLVPTLQADWSRWGRSLPIPATGRAVLQFYDGDDVAGQLGDGGYGLLAQVGVVADPWGPGGPDQILLRARRQLARISLTQRIPGWRGVTARILGEQGPGDYLGLATMLLVLPAPDSFPAWWSEALLAWLAREDGAVRPSTWRTLARTVWRLEAAAAPDPGQWRTAVAEWPFSLRASAYGLAYGEALARRFPGRALEAAAVHQARAPFWFNGAPITLLGSDHNTLLSVVADEIATAQQADLAAIQAAGILTAERRTPRDIQVRELVWLEDGTLLVREDEVLINQSQLTLRDIHGQRLDTWFTSLPLAGDATELRRGHGIAAKPTGTITTSDIHGRLRARLSGEQLAGEQLAGEQLAVIENERLRQGVTLPDGSLLAIRLTSTGEQALVHGRSDSTGDFTILSTAPLAADAVPWSPACSPAGTVVAWIERTAFGSRLMEAELPGFANPRQRWAVTGAMLLPHYTPDGQAIVVSSDHTGVANAWRIPSTGAPVAITNTNGGVLACLPSPDGTRYAIIDHDQDGAYLGFLPVGTTAHPPQLSPPGAEIGNQPAADPVLKPELAKPQIPSTEDSPAPPATPEPTSGNGLLDVGFRGVTPTTSPSQVGPASQLGTTTGLGVHVVAGDPLQRSRLIIGAGMADGIRVGAARYASFHLAPFELALEVHRHSNTYDDLLTTSSGRERYQETVRGGRVSASFIDILGIHAGIDRSAGVKDQQLPADVTAGLPFIGNERYLELTSRLDTRSENDLSPGPETGLGLTLEARHSGLGGDLDRNRAILGLEGSWSLWPAAGHQVVARTVGGWSDGDDPLQGAFAIGGSTTNATTILRGYDDLQAVGAHLAGWSLGYRMPLWRPRFGSGTQPWYFRQVVFEPFFDAAKASQDRALGDGTWYRSLGAQLNLDVDAWMLRMRPGLVFARQLDGNEDFDVSFTLGGNASF